VATAVEDIDQFCESLAAGGDPVDGKERAYREVNT
jgi:hypothetical protein